MVLSGENKHWNSFFVKIILPTVLAICFFVISSFLIIIPEFERNLLESRRMMIKELTNSAWHILASFEQKEKQGLLTKEEAQKRAINDIGGIRYGHESKDYFWIFDDHPRMFMHPYRPDLIGKDLSDFQDLKGKRLFVDFVDIVKKRGAGYDTYMWQWKDDLTKVVPKLSYVKGFEPWGWNVGTGIYIEDVKNEIHQLTARLLKISLGITLVISLLLFVIVKESLKIETERQEKEEGLKESREKYRTLVESVTEGIFMISDRQFTYTNQFMLRMLGYAEEEFYSLDPAKLLGDKDSGQSLGSKFFTDIIEGRDAPIQFEAQLKKKNGELFDVLFTISRIEVEGQENIIVISRDISGSKRIEEALGESKQKYDLLARNINVGIFRTTMGRSGRFIEANPFIIDIFGLTGSEELFEIKISDLFHDVDEHKRFVSDLLKTGVVKKRNVKMIRKDGTHAFLMISAVLVKDEGGYPLFCDGFIEDVTERRKEEEDRENLIADLQTSLLVLNEPVKNEAVALTSFEMNTPVKIAAKLMSVSNCSAALVQSGRDNYVGIITDKDIRERVVSTGEELSKPVSDFMTSPLITISEEAMKFEAMLLMMEKGVNHLFIRDNLGKIKNMISAKELLKNQKYPLAQLLGEIKAAESSAEIIAIRDRLPLIMKVLISSESESMNLTRIITTVSESVMEKLILLAVRELGPAPVNFVYLALGSVGRQEQTLKTDQDNAIIFEDVHEDKLEEVKEYFITLGKKVSEWLDMAGYDYCDGDIMASNEKWCQPVSVWKKYFSNWVGAAVPENLLDAKIFFDFRGVYGDRSLTEELKVHLGELLKSKPVFFMYLTQSCLKFKPPIGFFKNIVVESSGEHREKFSIKKAMTPIVDYVRIYALKHGVEDTNTIGRMKELERLGVLSETQFQELFLAYNYLMKLRFKHQAMVIGEDVKPDNYINPKHVSRIERTMLKEILLLTSSMQTRLNMEFKGVE